MQFLCPRCDAPFSSHDMQCRACGYIWLVPCASCGKPNIRAAHYCGRCGESMSKFSHIWKDIRRHLAKPFGYSARQIGTGFAFGGLLAFFAFGSLGMTSQHHREITPAEARAGASGPGQGGAQIQADYLSGLRDWRSNAGEASREASLKDLMQVGRRIIDTLSPDARASEAPDSLREAEKVRYLQGLRSGISVEDGKPVRRSDVALFMYRIASGILNVSLKSIPEANYTDIPRHHYMTVPIRTLESLGVRISRTSTVFGSDDAITVSDLGKMAADFLDRSERHQKAAAEKKAERKQAPRRKTKTMASAPAVDPNRPHVHGTTCKCGALFN